jgi:ABC-type hemin transport system ATPase subunit
MSAEELKWTVLAMADADDALSEDVKLLILSALESDEMFADVVRGDADPIVRPDRIAQAPTIEPVGAFLRCIEVSGFRGVGPTVRVPLHPGPGLVVIAGRNGSGKSTIAEALEIALTGDSYRWLNRTAVWSDSWRNLHGDTAAAIRVEIAEEGSGLTTIGLDWAAGADLQDVKSWVQRTGQKREPGFESLGWAEPIEMFRPLLSYDELGGVLDGKPSELYDKLFVLLGLERITDARNRLNGELSQLSAPLKAARSMTAELKVVLLGSKDPRATVARTLITKRTPDVPLVQALVTGSHATESGPVTALRSLATIAAPEVGRAQEVAAQLRDAIGTMAAHAGATADVAARHATLLTEALALHDEHGEQPCPVCGVGQLDDSWAERSRVFLDAERSELDELRAARAALVHARQAARDLIQNVDVLPAADEPELTTLAAAAQARVAWLAAPDDDLGLADHLTAALPALADGYRAVREQAHQVLAEREDLWGPLALKLGDWVTQQQAAVANGPKVAEVTLALNWLKQNAAELRNQRLAPLAERARHIWATLRQESNVGLGAIRLEGEATRRHVQLDAYIDGVKAGAFGVMSQGELHALALALFLPRATAPESPFRFVVLDDPIQAMDPSKVEGFVTVMQELAEDRQVIVLSHDDRLPAAIRRTAAQAQIFEITRGSGSVLTVTDAKFPSMRYLDDAYAFSMDAEVPSDAKNRVVPGLCRLALETAAYEVFTARAYSAGVERIGIEDQWAAAPKLKQRLALALHLDREAPITAWLQGSSRRSDAMRICNQGVHTGVNGNPVDDVRAVRTAVKDLRAAT